MLAIARLRLHRPVLVILFTVGFVQQAQGSPVYSVVDLGLSTASPTIPGSLMNPRRTNDLGDSVSEVPIYAVPDATHPIVPLGPSGFYAEFVPHDGNAVRIGLLGPDFTDSGASAINNFDQAVGESWGSANVPHAFVFTGGQTFDLNNLIPSVPNWTITGAISIDDQGRILGDATSAGSDHTIMLVPEAVPEPSMLVVVTILVAAASFQMARRNRLVAGLESGSLVSRHSDGR